ncbi:uncharacterized protein IAS62_002843 [Cryptococcus decagattii]|uniref:Uncharacterized protein n=1 Tax=Cryptococcus decagattii TaxID=1859122 RepID=A0ABZ2ASU8_9TREE
MNPLHIKLAMEQPITGDRRCRHHRSSLVLALSSDPHTFFPISFFKVFKSIVPRKKYESNHLKIGIKPSPDIFAAITILIKKEDPFEVLLRKTVSLQLNGCIR